MMFTRGLLIVCAALTFGATANAQTGSAEVARRELLQGADTARSAGDHARSLDLAVRAGQIRMTTSLRLLLAQEHEALGHLVDALDHASGCAREAEADAAMRNREQVLGICRALVTSITPRIGNLVVQVSSPPPGLVVRVAGHEVNAALYGVAFPVMPGSVEVSVAGEGIVPSREEVQVAAGARVEVTPRVRRAEVTPSAGADVRVAPVGNAGQGQGSERSSGPGAGPWVLVGVGGAAAIAGGVMLGLANSARLARDGSNDRDTAIRENDDWHTYAIVGDALMGVAVVGAVSGVLWGVLGRGRTDPRVAVTPVMGGAMLGVGGAL